MKLDAYSLKSSLVVIGFIITLAFGVLGLLACGTIGGVCQTDFAKQIQTIGFMISLPALIVSVLLLFLPLSLFGSIESD